MKTNNAGTGFYGIPIDPVTMEPIDVPEADHYYVCKTCGQAVDRRDLGQVFHHGDTGHEPLVCDS